ncbi:MAG: ABC transporter permease [Acidobacteriota bacterium]
MGVWVITGLTFREAARRKILLAALLLGLAFLGLYGLGLHLSIAESPLGRAPGRENVLLRRQIMNVLLSLGLYAVNWLTVMMTVLTSVDTLAGEISSGTIQAVVTKPIRRWEVVLGKFIGFAGMLTLYLLLMAGGVVLEVRVLGGYAPPNLLRCLALMWLEALLLLSVTLAGGAWMSTLATGVLAVGLHGLAFLGGWIEEFGSMAQSRTAVNIGIIASLVMPSEALWRRAAFEIQGPAIGAFGRSPFSIASVPSPAMVLYATAYLALALALAIRRFGRRDL